ncbi:transposase, partial [Paraburkholderia sp. EG285A]|uniref:transposase n=1 Tax=Paraburkholderia sp. EG285A TaxID=3237009 RepID=UPI0034D2FE3F
RRSHRTNLSRLLPAAGTGCRSLLSNLLDLVPPCSVGFTKPPTVAQGYSFAKACEALGVGDTALRRWVAQWRAQQGQGPRSEAQFQSDQRRIRELEARVMELEREREILKKSTAFFVKEWTALRSDPLAEEGLAGEFDVPVAEGGREAAMTPLAGC